LPATRVATGAVRSYRTFSPLPQLPEAVFFLCHYPSDCSARALPGALPSGVRTFLRPPPFGRSARQARRPGHRVPGCESRRSSGRLRRPRLSRASPVSAGL